MAAQKVSSIISNPFYYSNELLEELGRSNELDFHAGTKVNIKMSNQSMKKKLNPLLKLAKPEDAKVISHLVKEVYKGTYPYKEMEDESEIRKMIESGKTIFILFENNRNEIIGSTAFVLDFDTKRGNMRTWVVKREYHGNFESTKSLIGCCLYIWSLYKEEIFLWYGEVRTAHAKTQYILDLCSLKAVGLYPNKDVFFNQVETDILQVSYNKKALKEFRSKEVPSIIPEVAKCYFFSHGRYNFLSL